MRQLQTAGLVAAVALALAAGAQAATTTKAATPAGTVFLATQGGAVNMGAPRLTGPVNAAPTTTTTGTGTSTSNTTAPQNTTNVDVRAQQNQQAVSSTFASGSTSSLGPLAGTATTTTGTAGSGTTSGAGTGTPVSVGGGTTTGVTTGGGVAAFGNVGTAVGTPIVVNPADVTFANGTPTAISSITTPTFTNADVYANSSLAQNGIAVTEAQVNGANVDRAIAQVQRDRKRIGRNGQLLYSIAPRNTVDRTGQMPDDGPSPALTGSNSTLTR